MGQTHLGSDVLEYLHELSGHDGGSRRRGHHRGAVVQEACDGGRVATQLRLPWS